MTATAHALIGTLIAAKFNNPALAVPIALTSHIVADFIPHWDPATNIKKKGKQKVIFECILDVVFGFILSYLILKSFFPQTNIAYGFFIVFISQFFDWAMVPYYFFGVKPFRIFYRFQKIFDRELNEPWGLVTQGAFVAGSVLLLLKI